ncbi:MAG: metallophosphoesterase [Verrucomicrobiales bacterium]
MPPAEPLHLRGARRPQLLFKQKDDRNWRRTVELVNRIKPDFAIVCGDLIQAENDPELWKKPGALDGYNDLAAMYWKTAKQIDPAIKLYNCAGNHDVSAKPTPETLAWYREKFGAPWYRFEHKGSLFVVLESNLIRDPSGAPEEAAAQWKWFGETLEAAKAGAYAHKTAYMHHPLCLQAADEKDQYFNVPKEKRAEMIKRLQDAGFAAVFCGHYHRNAYAKAGDLEIITTSSCGAPLGKDPLGFRLVTVYPDRLEQKYYSFEELGAMGAAK